jgi:Tol biopolymer transport system component
MDLQRGDEDQQESCDLTNGDNTDVAFVNIRWSADSRWITYADTASNGFQRVFLYSLETGVATPLTADRYNSGSAAWSADNKWIYLISDRVEVNGASTMGIATA